MNTFPEAPKSPCSADAPIYTLVLPRLRAGALSPSAQEALRRHLSICAVCRDAALLAADQVVENGVRRQYGVPAAAPPFLTLDDIRRQVSLHGADEARSTHRQPVHLHDGGKSMALEDTQPDISTRDERPIKPPNRWRVAAGVVAACAIVALFALLLRGFVAGNGSFGPANGDGTATTGTQNATPTPQADAHGKWHTIDSMAFTTQDFPQTPHPVFSSINPEIVYQATQSPFTVRRSDDGGATWKTLDLPPDTRQTIDVEIFASPLDAHAAFLTVTTNLAYGQGPSACPSSARASVGAGTRGNILASGQMPCSTTYRTTDEGKTWKAITFPVNGTISTPSAEAGPTTEMAGTMLQVQGTRLFALLTCGPTCSGTAGRLVTSTDGGAIWHVADGSSGLGQGICDFATQPESQTVFAAVSNGSCEAINSPAVSLYRSNNAGQNWSFVSTLPKGGMSQGMAVVMVGGKPLLVMNVPVVSWQPHIIGIALSANEFRVSADGGHSWKTAPLQGVPAKAQPVIAPLMVRTDGSLIVAFSPSSDGQDAKLYSWKVGETSWRVFAPSPGGTVATVLRTVSTSGDETFWAVIRNSVGSTGSSTFAVASYQP